MSEGDKALLELFEAACAARKQAHAPYSQFPVGAAIRTKAGKIYAGCNVENASYPEGWCAETTAIGQMIIAGETEIAEVVVVAEGARLCTPCGGCRQRLSEFASMDAAIHVGSPEGLRRRFTLGELLPAAFDFGDSG